MTFKSLFGQFTILSLNLVNFWVPRFHVSHLTHETFKLCLQNTLNMSKTARVYFGALHSDSEQCTELKLSRVYSAHTLTQPACTLHVHYAQAVSTTHAGCHVMARRAPYRGRVEGVPCGVATRMRALARRVVELLPSPPVTIPKIVLRLTP